MLILTRREGECVFINDSQTGAHIATVRIMGVRPGGQVRVGFDAAPNVTFLRDDAKEKAPNGLRG